MNSEPEIVNSLIGHWAGFAALGIFVFAYLLVAIEEYTHLRKAKPMITAAGISWMLVAIAYLQQPDPEVVGEAVRDFMLEFIELFLFLLVAMTYVNAMSERRVFEGLRSWLVGRGYGYRRLFWITGVMAFFISPVIDNLTTALVMCAVVLAVGRDNPRFVSVSCINIVVAANAGGAFSPFGDITTLMVWQAGKLEFTEFFVLFIPAVVNFAVPALCMQFAIGTERPPKRSEAVRIKRGAGIVIGLFGVTILLAVSFHNFLHIPPFLGMITGLGLLMYFGQYLKSTHRPHPNDAAEYAISGDIEPFDNFRLVARAEWDTLLFFFGVIMCVGALGFIGYLALASNWMYGDLGPTLANSLVGVLSAFVDNIPVMVAVLQMDPVMDSRQWLLVTMAAGVGGSMLSIGSAAGVALMGQARGTYTFFSHLKWTPAIAAGYVLSLFAHLWLN